MINSSQQVSGIIAKGAPIIIRKGERFFFLGCYKGDSSCAQNTRICCCRLVHAKYGRSGVIEVTVTVISVVLVVVAGVVIVTQ